MTDRQAASWRPRCGRLSLDYFAAFKVRAAMWTSSCLVVSPRRVTRVAASVVLCSLAAGSSLLPSMSSLLCGCSFVSVLAVSPSSLSCGGALVPVLAVSLS
ncbi:hypothetical protein Ae201684P_022248 [Aphanomyces euteiches]|nr:hypothetical protein Ae201684P_022248 [Aphanomyces euteiches]